MTHSAKPKKVQGKPNSGGSQDLQNAQNPSKTLNFPGYGSPGLAAPRRRGGTAACRRRRRPDVAGARGSGAASACTHISHVTTKSCSWSRCSSPSVAYTLALFRSTRKVCGHALQCGGRGHHAAKNRLGEGTQEGDLVARVLVARVGVRDKVGPQCVTKRSTYLLGNACEQPA